MSTESRRGRDAVSLWRVRERFGCAALLAVTIETGRTHQIRVHMAAIRHPCVGDLMYGADPVLAARLGVRRQWLHAVRLGFEHPVRGDRVEFEAPYPDDLTGALKIVEEES
jgi:23S rRNA pseudouridine1911/1915/1917 synthase